MKKGILITTLIVSFIIPQNTYAYLDPGTGSYFTQIAIAMLLSSFFFIKNFWQKVKEFIKKLWKKITDLIFNNKSKVQKKEHPDDSEKDDTTNK